MRVAITGARGQLGRALQVALVGQDVLCLNRPAFDITKAEVIDGIASLKPELVIHAAAMTDVDGCELDPEAAYRVNALGTQNVALACTCAGADIVYISTDYVFDGEKGAPYGEFDPPNPLSVYGRSKLAGEWYVRHLLARFYIVRTCWLYSDGERNFVARVLQLSEERDELRMVTTEVGSPTYAPDLADALVQLVKSRRYGVYHLVNEGHCSRYELAKAALELAGRGKYPLHPTDHYPRAAKVPAFSALENFCAAKGLGIALRPWREALAARMERWAEGKGGV